MNPGEIIVIIIAAACLLATCMDMREPGSSSPFERVKWELAK